MKLEISSFVAGWHNGDYRDGNEGVRCIEDIAYRSSDSAILLFPGGFVVEDNKRDIFRARLRELGFNGVVIAGFDRTEKGGDIAATPVVVNNGSTFSFEQACSRSKEKVDLYKARQKRIFDYDGISIGVVSCGELFNKEFCDYVFKDKVDLLFGCVHDGKGFQSEVYRKRLNQYSRIASFYTYHSDSHEDRQLRKSNLSGAPVKKVRQWDQGLGEIVYQVDTDRKYKFKVSRKIRKF